MPAETDPRTEPTEMDRLGEVLKRLSAQQLVRVIGKLKSYQASLQGWSEKIEYEYLRRAAEITVVSLPGVRGNGWDPPRIRGLVEEMEYVTAAIRLAEEALADRVLREAAGAVLKLPPDENHAGYLVIESLVELVTDVAGGEEARNAVA